MQGHERHATEVPKRDGWVRRVVAEGDTRRCVLVAVATACMWLAACGGGAEHAQFYAPSGPSDGHDAGDHAQSLSDAGDVGADAIVAVHKPMGCADGPALHVLFIGNSHTYTNDLPALVQQLACDAGTQVTTQSATPGGVGFTEHAMDSATLGAIAADAWDFVVMQDQQQRPGWRLDDVDQDDVPALQTLVDAIKANRAKTRRLLYMVWARRPGDVTSCDYYPPVCTFEGNTQSLVEGYQLYAERTDSEVASVALAWAAVRADAKAPLPAEQLWMDDGSHAALPGSYLAAAVLVGHMLDTPTKDFVFNAGLDESVAAYLRKVADRIATADHKDPRVQTRERVEIACAGASACNAPTDAAAVTFTLSHDTCADLRAGSATVAGRIRTRMSHLATVPLGGWYQAPDAKIADGAYHVHVYVDVDDNGKLGKGDLDACEAFTVGGGEDLTISNLVVM